MKISTVFLATTFTILTVVGGFSIREVKNLEEACTTLPKEAVLEYVEARLAKYDLHLRVPKSFRDGGVGFSTIVTNRFPFCGCSLEFDEEHRMGNRNFECQWEPIEKPTEASKENAAPSS